MGGNTSSRRLNGGGGGGGGVIVVSGKFCASHTVELVITKKALTLTEADYAVKDVNGNLVFKVRGRALSFKGRIVLLDASGKPLVSMQPKDLTLHERWKAFKGDSSKSKDLLFSAKRSSIFQMKTTLDVFLASNKSEKSCDFKLKDSYSQQSCTIYNGDSSTVIAKAIEKTKVKNVLLGKDTFRVTVDPHVDQAFIVSLVIILIHMNKIPDVPDVPAND